MPAWSVLLLASVIGAGAASVVREGGPDARLVPAIDAIVAAPWELVRSATAGEPTPRRAGAQEAQRPRRAATVQVVLRARPSDARATLDGAPVELPFKGEFPFSAKPRVLEIVADGYRPYAHTFSFDRDTEVEVELQARPSPGLARRRASARSVPTAAPHGLKRVPPRPATSGAPAPKKQRGLDSLDPYASSS